MTTTFDIDNPLAVLKATREFVAASIEAEGDGANWGTNGGWLEWPLPTTGEREIMSWNQGGWMDFVPVVDIPAELDPVLTIKNECGTAMCVAGFVMKLDRTSPEPDVDYASYREVGERRLGLGADQATPLFEGTNTGVRVLAMLDALIGARERGDDPGAVDLWEIRENAEEGAL